MIGVSLVALIFNNQQLYQQPVGRIEHAAVVNREKATDQFNNVDYQFKQRLRIKVLNGRYRGKTIAAVNTYTKSGGMDQRYRVGQHVLLSQITGKSQRLTGNVTGLKRDSAVVALCLVVLLLLIGLLGRKGLNAFFTAILNIGLFFVAIKVDLQTQAQEMVVIFASVAFLMALMTLLITFGWGRQTWASLLATTVGVGIAVFIFLLVSTLTGEKGLYYEAMQYVTQNYRLLYICEVIIGCLGAVMDEASDILATQFAIKDLRPHVKWHTLFLAGRDVGKTVMGPLANVLLMIFLFSTLTNAVLMLRNGNSWGYIFRMAMSLGVAQSLVSGIGIVMTVPIISAIAGYYLARKWSKWEQLPD